MTFAKLLFGTHTNFTWALSKISVVYIGDETFSLPLVISSFRNGILFLDKNCHIKNLQVPFGHRVLSGKAFRVYEVVHVTDICVADLFKLFNQLRECQWHKLLYKF